MIVSVALVWLLCVACWVQSFLQRSKEVGFRTLDQEAAWILGLRLGVCESEARLLGSSLDA